ncbi:MAG: hypothetical protein EAZ92_10455 [Candidatus Kapaibacterium sp.]|nr:MAG: hypothetical protein EAZ92_10455 [Candidatus Kapabacteria bacterium]
MPQKTETKTRVNKKKLLEDRQIAFLIEQWQSENFSVKISLLEQFEFLVSEYSEIEIGNFRLTEKKLPFFESKYTIEIIDDSRDLHDMPIENNFKFLRRLQDLYVSGIEYVEESDLKKYLINHRAAEVTIGNILLQWNKKDKVYDILLVDKEKNIEGKISTSEISYKRHILPVIHEFSVSKTEYSKLTEVQINKNLETHFRQFFEKAQKSSGNLRGAYDLELGDSDFVIEIKLASSLKKTDQKDRASGQIKRYLQEVKSNNFLLLVIGLQNEKKEKNIVDIEKEVVKDFDCYFCYITVE